MSGPVLVAGGTGFLGREIVSVLASGGYELVTASRSPRSEGGHVVADLTEPEAALAPLEWCAPRVVVVLAGGTGGDATQLYRKNVLPTLNLLHAAAALALEPYFVVLGSAAEYGEGSGAPLREDDPTAPVTDYGRAKLAQTTLARGVAARLGLPLTVLRPFNVVSPQLSPSTALGHWRQAMLAARLGRCEIRCGRLDIVRDFIPSAAVAEAVGRLLERPAPGLTLNVCSGTGVVLGDVLLAMARRAECELSVVEDPQLARLPAPQRVVGDPRRLIETLDLRIPIDARAVAERMLD